MTYIKRIDDKNQSSILNSPQNVQKISYYAFVRLNRNLKKQLKTVFFY